MPMGLEAGRDMALSILSQYADFYTQFDGQSDAESWMLTGHAFNQALTEALWAVPLIHAYDLIADTLTDAQRKQLADELWGPLTAVMSRAQDKLIAQNRIESNYMAWLNVTLGCLGFTLNDHSLITRAIQPPAGFVAHLDKAILADGLEFEGTPYYHNFVLLAYLILAEAAKANNIDLYAISGASGQTLARMGGAFAQLAWPDGSIPDISDGSYWQDSIYDPEICQSFEILHAVERSVVPPENGFAWTLRAAYERQGVARDNWAALLYGRDDVETAVAPAPYHTLLEESGIAVLRSHKNHKLAVTVPFAPYRRYHHQHDRLSLIIWPFSRDAGVPLYGLPERKKWYLHSYAHNTLVVDEQSHAPSGAQLLGWDGQRLSLAAPDAYPGTDFTRTIEMKDGTIFDELVVQSSETHTFDWLLHLDGDVVLPPDLALGSLSGPLTTDGAGAYIELCGQKLIQDSVSLQIDYHSELYDLTLRGQQPFTLLIGTAPGTSRHPQQRRHVLIARTVGQVQRYWAEIRPLR